jgi:hypothetical protein
MIIYRQVKNQPGLPGPPGYQGQFGDQGYSQNCSICETEIKTMELPFEEPAIKQPVLPEKIDLKPRGNLIPPEKPSKITFSTGKIPSSNLANMWSKSSFRGDIYSFKEGNYPVIDKNRSNRISSLIVPENYWVTLYQNPYYGGRSVTYLEGKHKYVGNYINDRTSSVKVYKKPTGHAVLFEGSNWRGKQFWVSSKHANFNSKKYMRSIYVPDGYNLKVFNEINFTGRHKTFPTGFYTNISRLEWDTAAKTKLALNNYIKSCILEKIKN